jgi:hypothetical protein
MGDPWHRGSEVGELVVGGQRFQSDLVANDQCGSLSLNDLAFLEIGE